MKKRKAKPLPIAPLFRKFREIRDDDLECIIRLAVKAQARLAKEGIELHWSMSYRPIPPTTSEKP